MDLIRQPKIFISYRQNDSSATVNHLHQDLTREFGRENVFMDLRGMKGGDEMAEVVKSKIRDSDAVLVIIGPSWVSSIKQRQAKRKIDLVRLEVATALKARPSVRVIPVIVQDASFPAESDLPDDMRGLVGLRGNVLSIRWWDLEVKELIEHIKTSSGIAGGLEGQKTGTQTQAQKRRRSTVEISILGGVLAGTITGTILGIAYTVTERVSWSRVGIVTVYGLVAGFLVSALINAGIEKSPRVIRNALGRKFVGAFFGGALGGLLAGLFAGFVFSFFLDDNLVNAGWVVAAVALSSFFITAGILLPDLQQDWFERSIVLVGIAVITSVIAVIVAWLLFNAFGGLEDSPYVLLVLIFGLLYGAMAGAQVGLALVVYEIRSRMRWRQESSKVLEHRVDNGDE